MSPGDLRRSVSTAGGWAGEAGGESSGPSLSLDPVSSVMEVRGQSAEGLQPLSASLPTWPLAEECVLGRRRPPLPVAVPSSSSRGPCRPLGPEWWPRPSPGESNLFRSDHVTRSGLVRVGPGIFCRNPWESVLLERGLDLLSGAAPGWGEA